MNLKVKGLFGHIDYELDLSKDLNILVGENGKGKSTILKIITYVLNMNFTELTKIKFRSLEFSLENNFNFYLDYNDLFASVEAYWGAYSLKIEDEKNVDFVNIISNFEKGINNNKTKKLTKEKFDISKPDSANTKLISKLIEKFSMSEFNDFVSIVINNKERNDLINSVVQFSNDENSIFNFVRLFFKENTSKSITLESFSEFIRQVNKKVNPIMKQLDQDKDSKILFLKNSNLLNHGLFLNLVNHNKAVSEKNTENNNIKYLLKFNVKNLNMVELYDISGSTKNNSLSKSKENNKAEERSVNKYEANKYIFEWLSFYSDKELDDFMDNFIAIFNSDVNDKIEHIKDYFTSENSRKEIASYLEDYYFGKLNLIIIRHILGSIYGQNGNKNNKDKFGKISTFEKIVSQTIESIKDDNFDFDKFKDKDNLVKTRLFLELVKKTVEYKSLSSQNVTNLINKYLYDKKISIDIKKGLVVKSTKTNNSIPLEFLSSGEKKILTLLLTIVLGYKDTIYLIDEPELSLSIAWQESIVSDLLKNIKNKNIKIIIATQSNHIVNDNLVEYIVPLINRKNYESN
jgi:predicted ATPase